jgi:hypothetical protein
MDRLSDLPVNPDTVKTPEEEAIMGQFFPRQSSQNKKVEPSEEEEEPPAKSQSRVNWKLIGIACVIFVFLANPWVDSVLCKVPYCGSGAALTGMKLLLFAVLMIVLSLFV